MADSEAVRLFVERARAASPSFALTERNAALVGQICARLDGIPLAIELAAARVRALSVEQIAARLDDRFRLLTGGTRTALPRQQTLRGAVDWSYDLLSEPEQVLLRRLAVFAGGFTLEAAERVGSAETLVSLVEKSLVQVDEGADGESRYWLLETFREYGHERLIEHGELSAVRDRHRDYWLGVVEEAQPRLDGAGQLVTLRHLDREHDNLRASLAWCLDPPRASKPSLDRLATRRRARPPRSGFSWPGRSGASGGCAATSVKGGAGSSRVLELPSRADDAPSERSYRARAHFGAGNLMQLQFEVHAAIQHLEIALSLSRAAGDDRGVSQALRSLGPALAYAGDHDLAPPAL